MHNQQILTLALTLLDSLGAKYLITYDGVVHSHNEKASVNQHRLQITPPSFVPATNPAPTAFGTLRNNPLHPCTDQPSHAPNNPSRAKRPLRKDYAGKFGYAAVINSSPEDGRVYEYSFTAESVGEAKALLSLLGAYVRKHFPDAKYSSNRLASAPATVVLSLCKPE